MLLENIHAPFMAASVQMSCLQQKNIYRYLISSFQVVEQLDNLKQIEVQPNGRAEFSLDMKLHDPDSAINLYKVSSCVLHNKLFKTNHCSNKNS